MNGKLHDKDEKDNGLGKLIQKLGLKEYLISPNKLQIGAVVRNLQSLGVNELAEKAQITHYIITEQNKSGIFPYNRFLERGNKTFSNVISPDENIHRNCIVWCNNHYLGLDNNIEVMNAAKEAIDNYGVGCGTSAASGGFNSLHKKLERELAEFINKEEVVLYPTGFTANLGCLSTISTKGDLIIVDRNCHASIIDGVRSSEAEYRVFKHNNAADLEKILLSTHSKDYNNVFVLVESVYSMGGDEAPLKEYCKLKSKYNYYLFVDEAHAFGFYGERGAGLSEHLSCTKDVDFLMSTLSKATASIGGFIGCSKEIASYLRINSNPYLFQASITPADTAASIAALSIIKRDRKIKELLWKNTGRFREAVNSIGFDTGNSKSPIVPIYISDEEKLSAMCKQLFKNGIFTNWISYPAVKKGSGRLRFIVTANHNDKQIDATVVILEKCGKELGVI